MATPTQSEAPASLLLVDDHTVVRAGMQRILHNSLDASGRRWRVTEAGTGAQALAYLRSRPYRLAVVDLSMPGISGLALVQLVKAEFPAVAVLVLSMHAEEEYALRALMSGANGYVTKDSAADELEAAVLRVAEGGTYVSTALAERVAQYLSRLIPVPQQAELSGCGLAVMRRIVAGQRVAEIAIDLHVSAQAVSSHRSRLFERLQRPAPSPALQASPEQRFDNGELAAGGGAG